MARNKNPFFCCWKYPKWPKSCLRRLGTSWPRKRAVQRHKSHRMFVSLVFVKCLSDVTYIFLANIDIQWKLPTTEENTKIQLEPISKMCRCADVYCDTNISNIIYYSKMKLWVQSTNLTSLLCLGFHLTVHLNIFLDNQLVKYSVVNFMAVHKLLKTLCVMQVKQIQGSYIGGDVFNVFTCLFVLFKVHTCTH